MIGRWRDVGTHESWLKLALSCVDRMLWEEAEVKPGMCWMLFHFFMFREMA